MFGLGKALKVELGTGGKKKTVNLSQLEVIILTQLRAREIRNNGEPVGQYGYEMIQQLNNLFAGSWEAKSGTIYPILSKLEKNKKMILGSRKKSPLGPVKKVYILEDVGRETIDRIIRNNFDSDLEFVANFLNLISPFLLHLHRDDEFDEIYNKLLIIPEKITNIAKERAITEVDQKLRKTKLSALKDKLGGLLKDIDTELSEM